MSDKDILKRAVAREMYQALDALAAPAPLLAIIEGYGSTLSDEQVIGYLRSYNETGTYCALADDAQATRS